MNKELKNQISQLSESEQKTLSEYLKRQYAVEFKGEGMLRDDIRDIIFDFIKSEFTDPRFIVQEQYRFADIEMSPDAVNALSEMLIDKFELHSIEFSRVMEWQKVSDVIDYIETALEDKDGN